MSILIVKWLVPPPSVSAMYVQRRKIKQVLETCLTDRLESHKETDTLEDPACSN